MLFNIINTSDVRPGDHIYRYRWFEIQQGIAIRFSKLAPIFVVTSYKNTLSLVTLNEFKGGCCLRRVTYKKKLIHYRPPDEIVQNAILLLDWIKTSPDRVRTLFANDLSQFARKCCTTVHDQWRNLFRQNQELISLRTQHFDRAQVSRISNTFNAALLCGMPFRQASQIGKDELDENDPLLMKQDSNVQLPSFSENTSNETMIFSPTLDELPSDDELSSR